MSEDELEEKAVITKDELEELADIAAGVYKKFDARDMPREKFLFGQIVRAASIKFEEDENAEIDIGWVNDVVGKALDNEGKQFLESEIQSAGGTFVNCMLEVLGLRGTIEITSEDSGDNQIRVNLNEIPKPSIHDFKGELTGKGEPRKTEAGYWLS